MQKKVAILINEDFLKMRLGVNTNLAYIAGTYDLGHQLFIINIDKQNSLQEEVEALHLAKNDQERLILHFKKENQRYFDDAKADSRIVADLNLRLNFENVKLSEFDLVLQRLDPINPPFPPLGEQNIDKFLMDFVNFHQIQGAGFNLPVNCFKDKEFAQNISDEMGIKTEEADDVSTLVKNIASMIDQNFTKFVIKPDNLGQSKGVFAVNFSDDGLDLTHLEELNIAKIQSHQIHNIKKNSPNLQIILLNLLYCEALKGNEESSQKSLIDIGEREKLAQISKLFSSKILLQPFIEGVAKGDVRVNIAKVNGRFIILGKVFRRPDFADFDENFTTCVTSNAAKAVAVEDILTKEELLDLSSKMDLVLEKLNGKFAKKYQYCNEIGLDFIVLGDDKSLLLNEANHYCPALMPMSENVDKSLEFNSDSGLFLAKKLIRSWLN